MCWENVLVKNIYLPECNEGMTNTGKGGLVREDTNQGLGKMEA